MAKRKKYNRTNNDLQNITHKTKDRVTRTPVKSGGEPRCCGRVRSSCSTSDTFRVNLVICPQSFDLSLFIQHIVIKTNDLPLILFISLKI